MGALVRDQVAGVAEVAAAGVAIMRLLARMGEHVFFVARLLGQSLAADIAGEWLDAAMAIQVGAQR